MTARRNTVVLGVTGVALSALMVFPTSRGVGHVGPAKPAAAAGVVAAPTDSTSPAATPTLVVNGTSVDTRYGPVQVQIKVRNGKLTTVTAIEYPQGSGQDQEINAYAIPALGKEAVEAQSAHIDTVSGATYTSHGYVESLQAALDAAHV